MNMQSKSVVNPITSDIRVLLNFLPLKGGKFLLFLVVTIFRYDDELGDFRVVQNVMQPETFAGLGVWMRTMGFHEVTIPKSPKDFGYQLDEEKKWVEVIEEAVQDEFPF